ESGAIGAGVEAMRLYNSGHRTTFIGLDAVRKISYRTTRNEATRCNFCKNNCLRTFIDIKMAAIAGADAPAAAGQPEIGAVPNVGAAAREVLSVRMEPAHTAPLKFISKVPKASDERRLIISTCEKGSVEDVNDMRGIKAGIDEVKKANPNFVDI